MAKYAPWVYGAPTPPPPASTLVAATSALPAATRGVPYTASLTATGGTPPYSWSLVAPYDTLPTGSPAFALSSAGVITGTPTVFETKTLLARVTDSLLDTDDNGTLTLAVNQVPALAVSTAPELPFGAVNAAYSKTLTTTGGWGDVTWAVTSGSLPAGSPAFALSTDGVLTGTPTTEQSVTFTVRATDSESRTADQTFALTIRAEGAVEGAHDYFNYWDSGAGSTYKHYSNSLRTTELIESVYASATLSPLNWAYDADMDAVKWTPNYNGTTNLSWNGAQLVLPLNNPTTLTDRLVLVWDWYWPVEFKTNCGTITNYKTFQLQPGDKGWWTMMNNQGPARKLAANVGATVSDEFRTAGALNRADGLISTERVYPGGEGVLIDPVNDLYSQQDYLTCYPVDHSVWHRIIVEVKPFQAPSEFTSWSNTYLGGAPLNSNPMDVSGRWHMVSKWYMSETQDPQRVLYKVPMGWYADSYAVPFARLKFEMNSSKTGALGPMNGWGRNFLVLKNMDADETDTNLFRRPVR